MYKEQQKIEKILSYPVWSVCEEKAKKAKEQSEEEESIWNSYNLLATKERNSETDELIYNRKITCEQIANGNFELFNKLYYETPASEVWDYLAIIKAVKY